MKEDKTERLIKKYKEGQSTINEEQFLFDSTENLEPSLDAWFTFVKNNKTETPRDFNAQLWESFQNRKNRNHKLFVGIMSAAASVILLITIFLANPKQEELNYSQKETLLNLAQDMAYNKDSDKIEERIIYENEIVIIYTIKEK